MQKILIYGAGVAGERMLNEMKQNGEPYELVAFVDKRIGGTEKDGVAVIFPEDIQKYEYDIIFIATQDNTVPDTLVQQFNVPAEKINSSRYFNSVDVLSRIRALESFKKVCDIYGMTGSIAEVGVFQGDFAKHMNRLFPESKLYLYDTFEGFDEQDLVQEEDEVIGTYQHYANTSVETVLEKLPHPEKAVIRKGLFPDTATGEKDTYIFVNLDADLYAPILAGLEYFYPKMCVGGVIFVHDFFSPVDTGVKRAVTEFTRSRGIGISPVGDFLTVAITKSS